MAEMLINNWGGGIGDDPFLSRDGECLDMDCVDIRTTPRKISSDTTFLGSSATTSNNVSDTLYWASETIDGLVQSYGTRNYIFNTNISSLTGTTGADAHITIGANTSDYNSTTNPEGVRHYFFSYNGTTNPIYVVGYSGGVRAALININTSGGANPCPANLRTTAVCYLWKGAVIFARGSKIYEVNPEPSTPVLAAGAKVELPIGAVVKHIHYYNGLINFVYTIDNDTYIHGCTYDGTTYKLYPYADKTTGDKCLTAVGEKGSIYWVSTSGIYQYQGTSQLVKKFTFTTSAKCFYNKGVLRIVDSTNFYEFGVNKPGYGMPLTRVTMTLPGVGVTQNYVITFNNGSSLFKYDTKGSFPASCYYITHPYTAGQFGWNKKGIGLLIGYTLPQTYIDSSTQCTITVQIQTDKIYSVNQSTFVTVDTISDKTQTRHIIMPTLISSALQTAGYSDEFGWVKIKLILNNGDPLSGFFTKSAEVFDVYMIHEEIDNPFK